MNTPPRSLLKSRPRTESGPDAAAFAVVPAAVGEPAGVAEGVPSAVRPDPHPGDGRFVIAWLHISAPRGAVPTATSRCGCGRDRSAVGRPKVQQLTSDHMEHRLVCPLRTPLEGRAAA